MRNFDSFEKEILLNLKSLKENNPEVSFISLLHPYLSDKGIKIDFINKKLFILFDSLKYSSIQNNVRVPSGDFKGEAKNILDFIIRIGMLLTYLEKEGQIFTYNSFAPNDSYASYARITNDLEPILHEITDDKIITFLSKLYFQYVFVGQGLVDIVNNDFKTEEQLRNLANQHLATKNLELAKSSFEEAKLALASFKTTSENVQKSLNASKITIQEARKNLKTADIGLTTAILIGSISIIISTVTAYYTAKNLDDHAKYLSKRLQPIESDISQIHNRIGGMVTKINSIKKDTLNTRVLYLPDDTIHAHIVDQMPRRPRPVPSTWNKTKSQAKPTSPVSPY